MNKDNECSSLTQAFVVISSTEELKMAPFVQAELLGNQGRPELGDPRHLFSRSPFCGKLTRKPKEGLRDGRCPKHPKVYKAK